MSGIKAKQSHIANVTINRALLRQTDGHRPLKRLESKHGAADRKSSVELIIVKQSIPDQSNDAVYHRSLNMNRVVDRWLKDKASNQSKPSEAVNLNRTTGFETRSLYKYKFKDLEGPNTTQSRSKDKEHSFGRVLKVKSGSRNRPRTTDINRQLSRTLDRGFI